MKGQTVLVTKRTDKGVIRPATPSVYAITDEYRDGSVKVAGGDVWKVKPYGGPEADFIAVR